MPLLHSCVPKRGPFTGEFIFMNISIQLTHLSKSFSDKWIFYYSHTNEYRHQETQSLIIDHIHLMNRALSIVHVLYWHKAQLSKKKYGCHCIKLTTTIKVTLSQMVTSMEYCILIGCSVSNTTMVVATHGRVTLNGKFYATGPWSHENYVPFLLPIPSLEKMVHILGQACPGPAFLPPWAWQLPSLPVIYWYLLYGRHCLAGMEFCSLHLHIQYLHRWKQIRNRKWHIIQLHANSTLNVYFVHNHQWFKIIFIFNYLLVHLYSIRLLWLFFNWP